MPTWNPPAAPPPASNEHYSVAGNWTGGLPTNTTDAIFDGSVSNRNCIINTTGLVCFNFTIQNGYTGTITFTNTLTVRGSITFITSVNFVGPNGILVQALSVIPITYNSNNKPFNLPFSVSHNGATSTFVNTWIVSNFTTIFVSGNPNTYNGGTVNVTGNLTNTQSSSASTTQFILTGTGTFSATRTWCPPTEINTSSAITVSDITLSGGCVFKYTTASSFSATGTVTVAIATLNLQNIAFNNFILLFNGTVTLLSNANFLNATFGSAGGSSVFLDGVGQRFNVRGNLNIAQTPGLLTGTGILTLKGSGTISSAAAALGSNNSAIAVDLELDTSGTYTVTSNMSVAGAGKTFTRLNGTINWSTFTLFINTNRTFNTNGISFNNVSIVAGLTTTLSSTLTILGSLTLNGSAIFQGTAGWVCANLLCSLPTSIITLQSLITYTTTTSVSMLGSNAQRITMRSSDLTAPYDLAIWTFNGNTQSMIYVNATAINSSLGQTIWSFLGTPPTGIDPSTQNWNPGTKPETQGITFVN